jgi:hypothetical protein
MMAENTMPMTQSTADQPRVETQSLDRGQQPASVQYRNQATPSFDRGMKTRAAPRSVSG